MSKFSKISTIAAVLAVTPALAFSSPVFADSPGTFSTGPGMYQVRNESKGQATYQDSVAAACGETVKYTILLSNTANGGISDINVKTSLTSGSMTATGNTGTGTTTVTGNATVSLPSGASLQYVGPTQVINYTNHSVIATLDDGITTAQGTSAGNLAGSTNEWVQYKAKVTCDTPPPVTPGKIQVCELSTKKVITIKESDFNSAKHTKDLSKCNVTPTTPTTPTTLVKTGPADVAGIVAAVVAFATVGYAWVLRRQNAR